MPLRILLLADTHLGFDLPLTPRIRRRRRGPDFLANYHRALEPALSGEVDLVVHGGDVFHRSRVHHTLVAQAFEPLRRVADLGIHVFVVPGNHERARIPHVRFARHPLIHVFDRPRTFQVRAGGRRVALLGFPYRRRDVRSAFPGLVSETDWRSGDADVSLLCVHHCFEGAVVGPANFTFRRGADVIRCADIPRGLTAVLTGHVHRHQVLTADLSGRSLSAPVLYPGSTERTAFAEMAETKGALLLNVHDPGSRPAPVRWRFVPLPARPMVVVPVSADGIGADDLVGRVREAMDRVPPDAVLRLRILGSPSASARAVLAAPALRALAPSTMNVDVVMTDEPRFRRVVPASPSGGRSSSAPSTERAGQPGSSGDSRIVL